MLIKLKNFRPVRAELFHADGRTDMTKLIVAFRNFANTPKNYPWMLDGICEGITALRQKKNGSLRCYKLVFIVVMVNSISERQGMKKGENVKRGQKK